MLCFQVFTMPGVEGPMCDIDHRGVGNGGVGPRSCGVLSAWWVRLPDGESRFREGRVGRLPPCASAPGVWVTASGAPVCKGSAAMAGPKRRLDTLLAERGLFPSRSRAAAAVMAGDVCVGTGERRAAKPGELIDAGESLRVKERPRFVSRGGIKLANGLAGTGLEVKGRRALDVGASTGGFSDCLLQRGAREVIAVDVGYGTLSWQLRTDPRVRLMERTNARALMPQMLPAPRLGSGGLPDLATIDVSFISLTKVLEAVLGCLDSRYDVLALIKPQFEVGRGQVGKGGVVREAEDRRAALVAVGEAAISLGATVLGYHSSGLPGPKGNLETFVWLADAGRTGGSSGGHSHQVSVSDASAEGRGAKDLEQMARQVEP
jgi:23S rRNA (cytidine1920-2'-O)/16S rRNA (cytidine1409-2'-O)-methyltransferase